LNEKTDVTPSAGLEEAPAVVQLSVPIEQGSAKSARSRKQSALRIEDLRDADLKGKDLTKVKGLLPEHLVGADLTGAKLPNEVANFPALDQVTAISGEARKIFIGLLAACIYSWLIIGTTTDVALIVNTASSPLPIINTPIPIADFYWVGPTILAAVYCYLHFYLLRLWRTLATLPAVFPDGTGLDDKTDPWLLTGLVHTYMERVPARLLGYQENLLSIVSPGSWCRSRCSSIGSDHFLPMTSTAWLGFRASPASPYSSASTRSISPARCCEGRCCLPPARHGAPRRGHC
jgi:hypothetical protein